MTLERWEQVKRVYDSAQRREVGQRAAYLDQACAGDAALRREVESLLEYQTRAESFIEAPALKVAAGLLAQEPVHLAVGQQVGPYLILSLLGAGGMGEVYLAEDSRLRRKVAIKLLPARFTQDPERVRRFEREARAASSLNHPNIVTIYETGQVEGLHYIVTEYIDGGTLRQRIAGAGLRLPEALGVAVQVASALAAAHEAGIVHRDIKPENLMLRRDGLVKVLDFGLAKLTELLAPGEDAEAPASTGIKTEAGVVMGTVGYMSPEQARGQKVDARSDLFSLGVVLYEMVAGQPPFAGASSADVIASILQAEPWPLARHLPAVPEALEWIVAKMLRKDREERYQTAKEVRTDLKSLKRQLEFGRGPARSDERSSGGRSSLETAPGPAIESSSAAGVKPWRGRRGVTAALALGATAGVLTAAWFLLFRHWAGTKDAARGLVKATFTQLTDQPGPEYFPNLSPDGKTLVYASHASGNWDIYVQRVGGRNPINLTKDSPADDTQPAFSPDGEHVAFRSEREGGGIYLMGATGESVRRLSDFGYTPAWSPDGEQLLVSTEKIPQPSTRPTRSQLWAINLKRGERRLITDGDALQPSWSPHGQRIAYWSRASRAGQRENIWTIPADGGEAVAVTNGSTTDLNPVWSPDGKYLYFSSNRGGSMNIWRVAVDEKSGAVLGPPEAVTTIGAATSALYLSLSRDGRRLAYVAQETIRNLRKVAFDPSAGKVAGEPASITRGSLQLWFPDPSPDGQWLTCCSRGQHRHVFIVRVDGTDLRDLTDDNYTHDGWPRWSPDGRRIAFTSRRSGNYELWAINRDGSGLDQLTQSPGAHYSPWSPDGTRVAYSIHTPKNDCVIFQPGRAWGEQAPEALAPLGDPSLSFEGWSWSPDGKRLAGIRHLPNGVHSGVGIYDLGAKRYDWLTDFGDWPLWLNDNRRLLFVSQGKILLLDTRTRKYQPVLSVTDEDVDIGSPGLARDNRTIYFTYVAAEADIWLLSLEE